MPGFSNGIMYADNVRFDGAKQPEQVTANGELLIGSTVAPNIRVGFLTPSLGITVTNGAGSIALDTNKASTDLSLFATPLVGAADTAALGPGPSTLNNTINLVVMQTGEIMEQYMIINGVDNSRAPFMEAAGLKVSRGLTANNGAEFNWGMLANAKHPYTIGTSPAFFLEWRFTVADVSGAQPILCGFRKQSTNNVNYTTYTDYALIGLHQAVNAGTVIIEDVLNAGVAVQTDTTDAWADGETHTLRINVDAGGVVTYLIDGIAPSVTHAFTFDNGDTVSPMFVFIHGAAAPGTIHWTNIRAGLQ